MKKVPVYISLFLFFLFSECQNGARDEKNEIEPYPNTDTTKKEILNTPKPDSSSNVPNPNGDIH
jgi:hypothetical protein